MEIEFRTNDEILLLVFQRAKVRYENAVLTGNEDLEFEHELIQAELAMMDSLEDPALRQLAREANEPGKRSVEATQELLALSRRIKNLYTLQSHEVH